MVKVFFGAKNKHQKLLKLSLLWQENDAKKKDKSSMKWSFTWGWSGQIYTGPSMKTPPPTLLLKLLTYSWCQAVASNELFPPTCQTWCLEKGVGLVESWEAWNRSWRKTSRMPPAWKLRAMTSCVLDGLQMLFVTWLHHGVPWFFVLWKLALSFLVLLCFIYIWVLYGNHLHCIRQL